MQVFPSGGADECIARERSHLQEHEDVEQIGRENDADETRYEQENHRVVGHTVLELRRHDNAPVDE